jgi:hypothetical protein
MDPCTYREGLELCVFGHAKAPAETWFRFLASWHTSGLWHDDGGNYHVLIIFMPLCQNDGSARWMDCW